MALSPKVVLQGACCRAFSAVFGGLRALFPDDRELRDAIVPDVARASAAVPDQDDDDPTPVDA